MLESAPESVERFVPVVVGLGGSTRAASRSLAALRVALEGAAHAGAETCLLDLRELSLPILDAEQPQWTLDGVDMLLSGIRRAHALIVASPVYQQTISGALKNALDYLFILEQEEPHGLYGRVVGLVSASGELPSMGASLSMKNVCMGLAAWVLPESVDLGGSSFDLNGSLCDLLARDRLLALGRRVVLSAIARRAEDQAGAAVGITSTSEGT